MKASEFLAGIITGAVVGSVLGLLAAPKSGEELQSMVRARADLVMDEGRRAAAERRAELEAQFAQSKQIPLNS
jgi:gas vesicle protein